MIVRGPLVAIEEERTPERRLRFGCLRCGDVAAVRCSRRPCLGLDRGDACGVQALLMPQARHEAAARGGGRGEPCDALLGRGGEASSSIACSASRARRARELFPRVACLLDDPVVLAGGAAEAVEPGERFVERLGAQQERERVALVRAFVERPDELLRAGTRRRELRPSAMSSCFAVAARSCATSTAGRRGLEIACARVRARSRARRARGWRRSRAPRASRSPARNRGGLRTQTGGVRGERDRNGRQQGKARQDGHEARRAPR